MRPSISNCNAGLVEKFIGSAYDTVKIVADNIQAVLDVSENIDSFDAYLGSHENPPAFRNDGSQLQNGDLYNSAVTGSMYYWNSSELLWAVFSGEELVLLIDQAEAAAISAQISAGIAADKAQDTEDNANRAQGYAVSALNSQSAAKLSETNSETNKVTSQSEATKAINAASEAKVDATKAATKADDSLASATQSAGSAAIANSAKTDSLVSATNAANSASTATTEATKSIDAATVSQANSSLAGRYANNGEDVEVENGKYSAYHWMLKAKAIASNAFISGGAFKPEAAQEYPVLNNPTTDTLWIFTFDAQGQTYTYTSGSLAGKTVASGDQLLYDVVDLEFAVIPSGLAGAILSVNGLTTPSVIVESQHIPYSAGTGTVDDKLIDHQNRLDVGDTKDTAQDNRLNAIETVNAGYGTRIQAVEDENVSQDQRLTNTESALAGLDVYSKTEVDSLITGVKLTGEVV